MKGKTAFAAALCAALFPFSVPAGLPGAAAPAAAVPEAAEAAVGEWLDADSADDAAPPSSGEELLAECLARMPVDRVELAGWLNMRKRYGVSLKTFRFAVSADFRTPEAATFYRVDDKESGVAVLRARTVRGPDGALRVERTDFGPEIRNPAEPILGTDMTWLDVGLDFVHWRNPRLAGSERLKGRTCDILEVEPPAPVPGCAKARLWIDRSQKVVMQASQVNEAGRETRKLWVTAVQKVQERWIFKDMEVEALGTGHRTRVHFDEASFPDAPAEK